WPRTPVCEKIRIRAADPRHREIVCTTSNQSANGMYFMAKGLNLLPGMDVFVARNFAPERPAMQEERAVVVRVDSLGSRHVGVAIERKGNLPKRVLFVCIGNACRSPMAEAIARHVAPDVIEASSAGLEPLGYISQHTKTVLTETGVPSNEQRSKSVL